jgi:TonB family protein
MTPPVVVKRVEPDYQLISPPRAPGPILLEAEISTTGDVRNVRIINLPDNPFAEAAAKALKQWKFRPATLKGKPVPVLFNLSVHIDVR